MQRLRLAVKKDGALQFLSHLDFASAVRYVIIRSRLPIAYSEGFNPHMKLAFASALGVGVAADEEYMDMLLTAKIPVKDVIRRMNATAPHGFVVVDGAYVDEKGPKLMALANYAIYDLMGPVKDGADTAAVERALQGFNDAQTVLYEKVSPKGKHKVKTVDVKQHVIEALTGEMKDGYVYLHAGIYQTDEGAIKPTQLWQILAEQFGLPVHADMMLARRRAIYHREGNNNISLFKK